jgi:hypothetical protein
MAFTRQENVTITGFEDINISLFVPGATNVEGVQAGKITTANVEQRRNKNRLR